MVIRTMKRKVRSLFQLNRNNFKTYLKNHHFYPITYSEPQDVFIAGYPKSGNTWMQNILASIIFGIDPLFLPDRLTQELIPETKKVVTYYKRYLSFTCFKTHDLPKPEYRKVIYLVRDGRDAMASYFAMQKALGKRITLENMIVEGKGIVPCKWYEHSRKWIENPFDAEIIQIKYEDLLNEPKQEIKKICSFLGLDRSDVLIEKCIEGNSFKSMQKKEEIYGINNRKWNRNEKFVRKGKIGTYKTEIPEDLITYFSNESENELRYFGYL